MRVFRVVKNGNYCVMSNFHLRDKALSLQAKGLLSVILALPDNWEININGLCTITNQKKSTIKRIIKVLKDENYLRVNNKRDEKGKFRYEYLVYECNTLNPNYNEENIPVVQKTTMVERTVYKDTNTNKDKIDKTKLNLNFMTEYLIERGFIAVNDLDLFGYDDYFDKILNQHDVRDVYRVVTYTMSRIKLNNFKSENENEIINKLTYFITSVENNLNKLEALEDLFNEWNS